MGVEKMKMKRSENEEGFMIVEALLLLIAFVVFSTYVFNFFSAVHIGIVNQTHARAYLFETFQHRTNLRQKRAEPEEEDLATKVGYRFHIVRSPNETGNGPLIAQDVELARVDNGDIQDNKKETKFIWLKTGYGYCLTPGCQ
jgi:hypothetical protein